MSVWHACILILIYTTQCNIHRTRLLSLPIYICCCCWSILFYFSFLLFCVRSFRLSFHCFVVVFRGSVAMWIWMYLQLCVWIVRHTKHNLHIHMQLRIARATAAVTTFSRRQCHQANVHTYKSLIDCIIVLFRGNIGIAWKQINFFAARDSRIVSFKLHIHQFVWYGMSIIYMCIANLSGTLAFALLKRYKLWV